MADADDLVVIPDDLLELATPEELAAYAAYLESEASDWRRNARPEQLPPEGDWRVWYVRGGRGGGKTRTGSETLARWICDDPSPGEWAIVAPTFGAARDVCMDGPSGLKRALGRLEGENPGLAVESWNQSTGILKTRNGHTVVIDGAKDGAPGIQGFNLKGTWADEVGKWAIGKKGNSTWEAAWIEGVEFATRIPRGAGHPPQIVVTGTPKQGHPLVKLLMDDPEVPKTVLRTKDNIANLAKKAVEALVKAYGGKRLGKQELDGEFLEDIPGALWTSATLETWRIEIPERPADRTELEWLLEQIPDLTKAAIAVDPTGTSTENSDEVGIVGGGVGTDGDVYIVLDRSEVLGPNAWARKAVQAYKDLSADVIVAEVNYGGDMVVSTIKTVDRNVPVEKVTATRGKALRAQPVSSLFEDGRIHLVGIFSELEEQLTRWTPDSGWSPDRLDACLVGGTLVTTSRGNVPIEAVVPGDQVWTRRGWRPVLVSGMTNSAADVLTIETRSGRQLTGTGNHPVYVVGKGFTQLDAIVCGDIILGLCQTIESTSNSKELGIRESQILSGNIFAGITGRHGAAEKMRSIEKFGSLSTGISPRGSSSIISITTPSTMSQRTLLASRRPSMPSSMPPSFPPNGENGQRPFDRLPRHGMAQQRAMSGTLSMDGEPGKVAAQPRSGVITAASKPKGNGGVVEAVRHIAAESASRGPMNDLTATTSAFAARSVGLSFGRTSTTPYREPAEGYVVRRYASGKRPVYNLEVAGEPEYFANGLLVHNCVWLVTHLMDLNNVEAVPEFWGFH